ncbi:hypothetical protein GGI07_003818 [Coemansia sp. Benny D115]|nr:hypothetical protein GGI07_003818 [Coemansia sp. Benny D115]
MSSTAAAAAARIAREFIRSNKVMVFSKSYCPYCHHVKVALDGRKIEYKALELDKESNGSAIQSALQEITGQRTVPNIFANGYHVGGCDDTLAALENGQFKKHLENDKVGPYAAEEGKKDEPESSKKDKQPSSTKTESISDKAQL